MAEWSKALVKEENERCSSGVECRSRDLGIIPEYFREMTITVRVATLTLGRLFIPNEPRY